MHLAIRADGGPDIGYGHLARSGALAEEVRSRGHTVTYATTTPEHVRDLCPTNVKTVTLQSRDDPAPFLAWFDTAIPDVVFTDAYPVDTDYQCAVRKHVPLAVLQDDTRHAVCADVFVNGNLYATDLKYKYVDPEPTTYLGTDYVLLRRDIRNFAGLDPPWRDIPERALITMGGSDMANLTPTVVQAFDGHDIRVDTIVGPGYSENQEKEIRDAATKVSADVQVTRNPDDLPERMLRADFAVATASSTTYELLALGTPIVSIPIVDHQEPIATVLRERGIAKVLKRGSSEAAFRRAIEEYATDATIRRERRDRGRTLVDGQGTERVADILLALVER